MAAILSTPSKLEVSMTAFINFVVKSGTPKATEVKNWKYRNDYDKGQQDFYKILREGIIRIHKNEDPLKTLWNTLKETSDPKRLNNYPNLIRAYIKWVGKKETKWFTPSKGIWQSGELSVRVNPELGLYINGVPYLIKLYFKAEPKLTKQRIAIITHMMRSTCTTTPPQCQMAVLDVRNGKLHIESGNSIELEALLMAESACWSTLYKQL